MPTTKSKHDYNALRPDGMKHCIEVRITFHAIFARTERDGVIRGYGSTKEEAKRKVNKQILTLIGDLQRIYDGDS